MKPSIAILFPCVAILAGFISADDSSSDYIVGTPKPTSPFPLEYTFNVGRTELAPDGFSRRVWTVNEQFPGPPIHVFKDDVLKVNVINNLGDESTAIHWHGIFQNTTPWYDGVPGSTQCGIPTGSSLNYEFATPTAGTFWWHSHFTAQYVDGMIGPLIVHDKDDPYLSLYDEEMYVIISDWYHTESPELIKTLKLPVSQGGKETTPDAGIINGRTNSYNCSQAPSGSNCKPNAPLSKFKFECGKRYRLRIINTSAMSTFKFSMDGHLLNVIEADGFTLESYVTHRISIAPAQRYSVIVEAKQTPDNYFMRADFDTTNFFPVPQNLNPNVTAIVHYDGAPEDVLPKTSPWDYSEQLNEKDLRPYFPTPVPSPVGKQLKFDLNITTNPPQTGSLEATINNSSFVPDLTYPALQKVLDYATSSLVNSANQNAYVLPNFGEVVEIVLHNLSPVTHPFHLHGHNFWTLGFGNGTYVEGQSEINTQNAIKRDTYNVPGNGWAVIRFIADNPGVWTFHCHIEWHLEIGLSVQLVELPDMLQELKEPDDVKNLCKLCSTSKARKLRKRKGSPRLNS